MQLRSPISVPDWRAYTRAEAARIGHVPVSQVDAALKRGELEHVRIGKHIRISDSALRRWLGQDASGAA